MTLTRKWLDAEYIKNLKELAKFYAASKMAGEFEGDEATVFSLLMRADSWGVHPDYVLQGCFNDQWGNISYTGKLIKLVLENCDDIQSMEISEHGNWAAISKKYRCINKNSEQPIYEETWDKALAGELGLTIKVQFFDKNKDPIEYTVMLTDIDPTVKDLNPSWVTSPRSQLENVMLRDLAHAQLYQYINAVGADAMYEKQEAKHSDNTSITDVQELPSSKTEAATITSPITSAENVQKQMIKDFTECEDIHELKERLDKSMNELVDIVKASSSSLDERELYKLRAIYQESKDLLHRQVTAESQQL